MRSPLLHSTVIACLLFSAGCRRQTSTAATTATDPGDEALVRLHSHAGIGAALSIGGRVFHAGEPVPIHLALEDFAALKPLDGNVCSGLYVSFTETTRKRSVAGQPAVPLCKDAEGGRDRPPLSRGKLFTIDTDLSTALNEPVAPGLYQVMASWQPGMQPVLPVGPNGENIFPTPYAVATSNVVDITVLP